VPARHGCSSGMAFFISADFCEETPLVFVVSLLLY
jgi:hypothetical protein